MKKIYDWRLGDITESGKVIEISSREKVHPHDIQEVLRSTVTIDEKGLHSTPIDSKRSHLLVRLEIFDNSQPETQNSFLKSLKRSLEVSVEMNTVTYIHGKSTFQKVEMWRDGIECGTNWSLLIRYLEKWETSSEKSYTRVRGKKMLEALGFSSDPVERNTLLSFATQREKQIKNFLTAKKFNI